MSAGIFFRAYDLLFLGITACKTFLLELLRHLRSFPMVRPLTNIC